MKFVRKTEPVTTEFKAGDFVQIIGDPEEEVFQILCINLAGAEIESNDRYIEGIPARVLKLSEKKPLRDEDYGPGSVVLDEDGDLWLKGPNCLWDFLTVFGAPRDEDIELDFTETLSQINGFERAVYVAPTTARGLSK